MFWLSYESFSILCDAFLLKSVISGIMPKYQTNLGIHGNILLIKQIDLLLEVPKTTT